MKASPIGISLGGFILVQKPLFHTGEIRNFTLCFITALAFEALALVWIVIMVREEVARKQELKIEMKIRGMQRNGGDSSNIKLKSDISAEDEHVHPIKLLFDMENLKSIIRTILKKRPNKARKQLFLLFVFVIIISMVFDGN